MYALSVGSILTLLMKDGGTIYVCFTFGIYTDTFKEGWRDHLCMYALSVGSILTLLKKGGGSIYVYLSMGSILTLLRKGGGSIYVYFICGIYTDTF